MQRHLSIALVLIWMLASGTVVAQEDPRLSQAATHFKNKEYAQAAELLDEIAKDSPSNLLNLNAMAAWYKADRCDEAMAARGRVDRTQPLEPQDIEDLDRVNAYCKLKSARSFREAREWDKALGLLAGLETQDQKLAGEIVALRQEIELDKKAAQEQAELDRPKEVDKPADGRVVEPPPQPTERPKWALYSGLGLLGGGVALGVTVLVKRGIDQKNANKSWELFDDAWGCTDERCEQVIPEDHDDRMELENFQSNIRAADTANVVLGVTAGAAGAAGAVLLIYYLTSGGEQAAAVAPMLGPDARGVTFSLQF